MVRMVAQDRRERVFINANRQERLADWVPDRSTLKFHQRLPGYAASPLREAPHLAASLGLDRLWVKDESSRFGLPAFKILGASWAVANALNALLPEPERIDLAYFDLPAFRSRVASLGPLTLTCATDGNHGRAVAWMAKQLGLAAHILVPDDMAPARIDAIRGEGASVQVVNGSYDEAVELAAAQATPGMVVISDTSWPGYVDVPRWVIEGYGTMLWEVDDALQRMGEPGPDLVVVQIGVGALAAAVVRHFARPEADPRPVLLGIEPTHAACAIRSAELGEVVQIEPPHDSIMSGLNCGTPSPLAWPTLAGGLDAFVAVDDERAIRGMRALADEGIVAGECGAAGVAGLLAWRDLRGALPGRRALVITTEGATDPAGWEAMVGRALP